MHRDRSLRRSAPLPVLLLLAACGGGGGGAPPPPSGTLDAAFGTGGAVTTAIGPGSDEPYAIAVQADGRIVVAGLVENETDADFGLVRYRADGALDATFGDGGKVVTSVVSPGYDGAFAVAQQPDGKLVAAGYAEGGIAVVRYLSDGVLDAAFGPAGGGGKALVAGGMSDARAVALQPDGKLLVAGEAFAFATGADFGVARLDADGSPDATFGTGGVVRTPVAASDARDGASAVALLPDGRVVAAGTAADALDVPALALVRYGANGDLDATFGAGGVVTIPSASGVLSLAPQADGALLVIATTPGGAALLRLESDGDLDPAFGADGVVAAASTAVPLSAGAALLQPDGRWVVAGSSGEAPRLLAVARFLPGGEADASFGSGGVATVALGDGAAASALALQPNGSLVAAGWVDGGSDLDFAVVRLHP